MLDRVWWIWQMQDPEKRVPLIPSGAGSMPGMPSMGFMGAGPEVAEHIKRQQNQGGKAADTLIDLNWTAPKVKVGDVHDTLGGLDGAMCYIYV